VEEPPLSVLGSIQIEIDEEIEERMVRKMETGGKVGRVNNVMKMTKLKVSTARICGIPVILM
jgi:hypothetical protein